MNNMKLRGPVFLLSLLALLYACEGGHDQGRGSVVVRDAWARAMPLMSEMSTRKAATNSAMYLVLDNRGPEADRLLGGAASVARAVELHESRIEDGVMRMRPVEGVDLQPGETVTLQPGGLHLMLVDLRQPLEAGDSVRLTLRFLHADPLEVSAEVRGPGGL